MIGQPAIESALVKNLPVPVRYGVTVESLEETVDSVTVVCNNSERVTSKYVIAADGAHSPLR